MVTAKSVEGRILQTAIANNGVVGTAMLTAAGVGSSSIAREIKSGLLRKVSRGTYVVPSLENARTPLYVLAYLHPWGAACLYTAAAFHGFALPWQGRQVQFVVPRGTTAARPSVSASVFVTRDLPKHHIVRVRGLPVTSPARTICDLAPKLARRRLVHLVETQLSVRCPNEADLVACVLERRRPGIAGMARLVKVLDELLDDQPFPESKLEQMLLDGLSAMGLDGLTRQYCPSWYDGVRGIVDVADVEGRTVIEADGRRFRQVTQAHDNDRSRDRRALAADWVVIRVGYRELRDRPAATLGEIHEIVIERRRLARLGQRF